MNKIAKKPSVWSHVDQWFFFHQFDKTWFYRKQTVPFAAIIPTPTSDIWAGKKERNVSVLNQRNGKSEEELNKTEDKCQLTFPRCTVLFSLFLLLSIYTIGFHVSQRFVSCKLFKSSSPFEHCMISGERIKALINIVLIWSWRSSRLPSANNQAAPALICPSSSELQQQSLSCCAVILQWTKAVLHLYK